MSSGSYSTRQFPDMDDFGGGGSGNSGMFVGVIVVLIAVIALWFLWKRVPPGGVAPKQPLQPMPPLQPPPKPTPPPPQTPPAVAQIPLANSGPMYPAGAPQPAPVNTFFGREPQYAEYTPSANYNLQFRQPINATKISLIDIKTPETFQDIVLTNKKDCVAAFISRNCGHCTAMKPAFEQAANQSMIPFLLVEQAVAQPAGLLEKYQVQGFPTIIRFSGGLPVGYFKEARTPENLIKFAK